MPSSHSSYTNMDAYIASFPPEVQAILQALRRTIRAAAPEAEETISYAIPTFKLHGNLVHFAAFPHHIGFYPGPSGIAHFQPELAAYKSAKGSVQFPLDQPLPLELISRMVRFRVAENLKKAEGKKTGESGLRHKPMLRSSSNRTLRTCPNGHSYWKSSACPVCPRCEAERQPAADFLKEIGAPARRALEGHGITSLEMLSRYSQAEILALHGMGPTAIRRLGRALASEGLSFKESG